MTPLVALFIADRYELMQVFVPRSNGSMADWRTDLPWCRDAYDAFESVRKRVDMPPERLEDPEKRAKQLPYSVAGFLAQPALNEFPHKQIRAAVRPVAAAFCQVKMQNIDYQSMCRTWLSKLRKWSHDDADFTDWFKLAWNSRYGDGSERMTYPFNAEEIVRAYRLGLLPDNDMKRQLAWIGRYGGITFAAQPRILPELQMLTNPEFADKLLADAPKIRAARDAMLARVFDIEIQRGEMPTPATGIACNAEHFMGAARFVEALEQSGEGVLDRTVLDRVRPYIQPNAPRQCMISHLLHGCYPLPGEDAATLKKLLAGKHISDQRLIDSAMFAPQWLEIVCAHLGWEGLDSACWYFQAHSGQEFSPLAVAKVALYSDISPEDFNDGAFDLEWFRNVYKTLGAKRFEMVYAAAKYISSGPWHRRAQMYADAISGKLSIAEAEKGIAEKRSQNHVLAYGLIPLPKKNADKEVLRRYLVLQDFIKGSKQFGAQRRTSESRAADIGMQNLARNAGFENTTRFTWKMENDIAFTRDAFARRRLGGKADAASAWLEADAEGHIDIRLEKNGKELKSVPAALKKDAAYIGLLDAKKMWRDQQSRIRGAMERAMVHGEAFDLSELAELSKNPAFAHFLNRLVFKAGDRLAYLDRLVADKAKGAVTVAHPVHMRDAGVWAELQKDLFDRQITQPFKQVFRELYVPTREELKDNRQSARYATHQVMPKRAGGLLKSRGWTMEYEGGFQRVFLRENVVARLDSFNTWAESPTLGDVSFRDRHGGSISLAKVPPVLFSEVMRDLDLAVSVAFVGNADPDASESTVEMRLALAREAVRLFKLGNVAFKKMHAFIKGTRGDYTVHMGSGVMHQQAGGALDIRPVLEQRRGKIFLPFADDDPRTAEIMTKILLFAHDETFKDPAILRQILNLKKQK